MEHTPLNIFIVEDNPRDAELITAALEGGTLPVSLRHSAHLGEALATIPLSRPDAIVMDLTLPDAIGLEGLLQIQAAAPGAVIVVLADAKDAAAARHAVERGAADYILKKDLDTSQVGRTIRNAVERERLTKALDAAHRNLRASQVQMERLALLDTHTELLNRRGLQHALTRELEWCHRHGSPLMAVLANLDGFKRINDALGHAVGDIVILEVSRKIKKALRATDYAARLGGDEFLILLPQTRSTEGIRVAEKLRLAIGGSPLTLASGTVKVTASLALVDVPAHAPSVEEIISHGHFLMRRSRTTGVNRVAYSWSDLAPGSGEVEAIARLLAALKEPGRFWTVKHPIMRLEDESLEGFEFLSRTSIEAFEMPVDFFRVSLEANLLTVVDHLCFKTCVSAAVRTGQAARCHVNLFPSTLIGIPPEQLVSVLPKNRKPGSFCIEISEQQILGDPSYLAKSVEALKREGVQIAIDDVGFGRTCLESLILLEPDVVKIDKKCVIGIARDPLRKHSLKRLLNIIQTLGADAVAEGVETREDLAALKQLGVPYGQGFLWGKPTPAE